MTGLQFIAAGGLDGLNAQIAAQQAQITTLQGTLLIWRIIAVFFFALAMLALVVINRLLSRLQVQEAAATQSENDLATENNRLRDIIAKWNKAP